jgi:CubicO group peptidase (beta-lactamase class C family)
LLTHQGWRDRLEAVDAPIREDSSVPHSELPLVTQAVQRAVEAGSIPGAVVAIRSRDDVVHLSATGTAEPGSPEPLHPDTVMWLASLSKPIGAAAVMLLAQDGALAVSDPVSRFIPEFAAPGRVRVLRPDSPSDGSAMPFGPPPDPLPTYDEVPADRELTVSDLLTHTGGLQSIFQWNPELVPARTGDTLATHVQRLAGLVRDFQPGTRWAYSNIASYDTLSRVVEIASGRPLREFLQDRLLGPLGSEVGFGRGAEDRAMTLPPFVAGDPMVEGTTFTSTAAGLWGTALDYLAFAEVLRTGRATDGTLLLSPETLRDMTTNQVGDLVPGLNGRPPTPGFGFGLGGVTVVLDPTAADVSLPAGTFGWDGVTTRRFWVDPTAGWSAFLYVPDQGAQRAVEAAIVASLG